MTAAIKIRRRALPLLALAAVSGPVLADTVDLSVTCDTTLAPALRKVAPPIGRNPACGCSCSPPAPV